MTKLRVQKDGFYVLQGDVLNGEAIAIVGNSLDK